MKIASGVAISSGENMSATEPPATLKKLESASVYNGKVLDRESAYAEAAKPVKKRNTTYSWMLGAKATGQEKAKKNKYDP